MIGPIGATGTTGTTGAKICGLTNGADLAVAVDAGAAAVGFVVGVPVDTPREVSPKRARRLLESVPSSVRSVLVTMPDSPDEAVSLVEGVGADALQIHGANPAAIDAIRTATDAPVLAAIDAAADVDRFAAVADALLVDSLDAAGAGGTGEAGDWDRARAVVAGSPVPVLLAGGLTPGNVASAVEATRPVAVDVASGVEERGGRKDHEAVRAFVARAIGARSAAAVQS
jgi:phosphoribosylanthranilate isomerase